MGKVMFPSFRLGTLFGFPIKANLSFLLLLGAVFVWMGGWAGLAVALVTAGSVVLHELGHAATARRLGVRVADIELHFFGGAAQIVDLPRTPRDEMLIAAAGPAVSFALAGVGYGLATLTGASAWALFALINVVLGAFNLLPAFPSDGGRILRAALVRGRGLVSATDLAVKVGRVVCIALALVGLWQGALQLVAVAAVLWMMGTRERLAARLRGERGGPGDGWSGGGPGQPVRAEYFPPSGFGSWATMPPTRGRGPVRPDGRVVVKVWRF
jgi:Zn-dependent protease